MKSTKNLKNILKIKLMKIFIVGVVAALAFNLAAPNFLQNNNTAYAIGDLNVDWGVTDGSPIFVVNNMMPGDIESRSVNVINNATSSRPVAVRGVPTSDTDNLSTVLDFVISEGLTDLYGGTSSTGPKTLADFFAESDPINGIALSVLGPSTTTTYIFKATFQEFAENEFQNASVVFDLIIGIAFEVPAECQNINFAGNPIFGTSGNDNIKGTNFNDLIIVFEGDDKVNGSNGDDCIVGGPGNDKLDGSNGNDVILGGEGNDTVDGSNGNDWLIGGAGNDKINGSNGDDQINAEEGNDQVEGSNGNDHIILGPGNDKADAGNGNDYVEGNDGNDEMRGRNGNDNLIGGPGTDKATGDLGTDTCDAETEISCEL